VRSDAWIVAEHAIADYDETAGATLNGLKDLPPEAIAEVSRVAAAILELVEAEQPPMRLVLGGWAGGIIRKEIAARSADLENWSHLTMSVDIPLLRGLAATLVAHLISATGRAG